MINHGILGKTDVAAKFFDRGTITVDMFGHAFYRRFRYKMVTHARVFSLKPKIAITDRQGLFLTNALHFLPQKYGFANMCSWEKIKKEKICLPVIDDRIDLDFMERFIAEAELRRIRQLNAYLYETGLTDYTLNEKEKKALADYETTAFGNFPLTSLFDVNNTYCILSNEITEGSGITPYLCASSTDNGVSAYIKYDNNYAETGNCIFIGGKTFVVTYQANNFFSNDSHNLTLYLKDGNANRLNQLFLATCIKKSLGHRYAWGNSISHSKIQHDWIALPIKNGQPDFDYMETFSSAIQKMIAKNLVMFVEQKMTDIKNLSNHR